jgi:recombination protein RecT
MEQPKKAVTALAVIDTPSFKKELERALPNRALQAGLLTPERVVRLALTQIRGNEALQRCAPISIMACVVEAAQLGLELDRITGHAYLVPFGGEATLIVGYRGFVHLMFNAGTVASISAEVVRKGDKFKRTLGTHRGLVHEPAPIPAKDGPEFWLGAYAAVQFITGATDFEYLEKVKIEAARNRSRGWQAFTKGKAASSPWDTDTEEMWRKTAIRRLAKRCPTSTTDKRAEMLQRATILDEYAERRGLLIPTLHGFDVNPEPPEPDDPNPLAPTEEVTDASSDSSPSNEAPKQEKAAKKSAGPPKAQIPPEPKVDDPVIDMKEQTDIYSAAVASGWKVPDEVLSFLRKNWKLNSIRDVRRSQLPEIMRQIKAGT